METSSPPHPTIDPPTPLYYQLVYTLTDLLPPPLDDTPEGLRARNHAAIAKVAALLPVDANEVDLAAQCVAARAQAEAMLRLIRQNADDIGLVMRLNAQYGAMVRTSLSVLGRLMRVQAVRHKRAAMDDAANQDAWTQHIAERTMLRVADPGAARQHAAPATPVDQRIAENTSENETNSQDAAFETWMSALPWNGVSTGSDKTDPRDLGHELMLRSRLAGQASPANGPEPPGRPANPMPNIDHATGPANTDARNAR